MWWLHWWDNLSRFPLNYPLCRLIFGSLVPVKPFFLLYFYSFLLYTNQSPWSNHGRLIWNVSCKLLLRSSFAVSVSCPVTRRNVKAIQRKAKQTYIYTHATFTVISAQPLVLTSHNRVCHIVEDSPTASRTGINELIWEMYRLFATFPCVYFYLQAIYIFRWLWTKYKQGDCAGMVLFCFHAAAPLILIVWEWCVIMHC